MDLVRLVISDYLRGLIDSFQVVLMLHKLDVTSSGGGTAPVGVQSGRNSSGTRPRPLTTLELRRRERARSEASNSPTRAAKLCDAIEVRPSVRKRSALLAVYFAKVITFPSVELDA